MVQPSQPTQPTQTVLVRGPDRSIGSISHFLGPLSVPLGFFLWLVPIIAYIVKNNEHENRDEFLIDHLREAANAAITFVIASIVHVVLMFVLVGFVTFVIHWVAYLIWAIQANSAMGREEMYQYPMTIRMFNSPQYYQVNV